MRKRTIPSSRNEEKKEKKGNSLSLHDLFLLILNLDEIPI